MYAVEDRHHPVPPPLSMDRISAPSVQYPSGPNSLRQSDHLAPVTNYQDGRSWSLQVVQQPIRARMCGFGDKVGDFSALIVLPPLLTQLQDRRPITPPPCIRLIVRDAQTDKEIDIKYVPTSCSRPLGFLTTSPSSVKSIHHSTCSPSTCGMPTVPTRSTSSNIPPPPPPSLPPCPPHTLPRLRASPVSYTHLTLPTICRV